MNKIYGEMLIMAYYILPLQIAYWVAFTLLGSLHVIFNEKNRLLTSFDIQYRIQNLTGRHEIKKNCPKFKQEL